MHPVSPSAALAAVVLAAGALALPGCGDAPTRITPATPSGDQVELLDRDLEAAAAAERSALEASRE